MGRALSTQLCPQNGLYRSCWINDAFQEYSGCQYVENCRQQATSFGDLFACSSGIVQRGHLETADRREILGRSIERSPFCAGKREEHWKIGGLLGFILPNHGNTGCSA